VTAESWAAAREWADAAKAALAPLPDGVVKHSLAAFADAVVDRQA